MKRLIQRISVILILIFAINVTPLHASAKGGEQVKYVGIIDASSLRLRSGPSTAHPITATAPRGDYVLIIAKSGSWYKVIHNLTEGYMHESYLDTYTAKNVELGYGVINGSKVNLRSGPSINHSVLQQANKGDRAYIIGFNNQWYKVIFGKSICYVRSDFLDLTEIPYENQASKKSPLFFVDGVSTGVTPSASALNGTGSHDIRNKIVSTAKKFIGVPYAWGGTTPSGFDCSGYVQYVMKQHGISLPRTTDEQYKVGAYVSKTNLLPGDLVFLANTYRTGISHVGIYIGDNKMIHASSSKGVTISSLSSSYYVKHYYGARRVV